MSATRLLAVGVSGNRDKAPLENKMTEAPSMSQIIEHMLTSAFVDTLDNDLEFLRDMNEVLDFVLKKLNCLRFHPVEK